MLLQLVIGGWNEIKLKQNIFPVQILETILENKVT